MSAPPEPLKGVRTDVVTDMGAGSPLSECRQTYGEGVPGSLHTLSGLQGPGSGPGRRQRRPPVSQPEKKKKTFLP